MDKIFSKYKKIIDKESIEIAKNISLLNLNWSKEVSVSLKETVPAGKSVRGSLILMTLELFDKKISNSAIKIATVIEYLHTALLIQDDIMDHDDIRRGQKTMHKKYEHIAKDLNIDDAPDFGKSMAICIADVAIFYALKVLSNLKIDDKQKSLLFNIISNEFSIVGFGQIQDLVFSHSKNIPSDTQVLNMYQYKTARYTFSLPFTIASVLAKQKTKTINDLDKLGVYLGLIFQLTDDALTLDGNAQKVGKTIGNDIVENKKTLYHVLLRQKSNKKDLKLVSSIFGKDKILEKDVMLIKTMILKYKINEEINLLISDYKLSAEKIITKLDIKEKNKYKLNLLIKYLLTRRK